MAVVVWHNLLAVVYPVFIGWVIWKTVYTRFPFASGLQMRMYTIVMYDRDWQNQALDGTGDSIPFHWRRPTLWEVLLVIWCER